MRIVIEGFGVKGESLDEIGVLRNSIGGQSFALVIG